MSWRAGWDAAIAAAARVADLYAETNLELAGDSVLHDPVLSGEGITPENVAKSEYLITDGCIHSSMYHAATNIAAAIRALKPGDIRRRAEERT